jgi:hypothetical protein
MLLRHPRRGSFAFVLAAALGAACDADVFVQADPGEVHQDIVMQELATLDGGATVDGGVTLSGVCLTGRAKSDDGGIPCFVIEASWADGCRCDVESGRLPISAADREAAAAYLSDVAPACICELRQASEVEAEACRTEPAFEGVGWCYLDDANTPDDGTQTPLDACPSGKDSMIRTAFDFSERTPATLYLACTNE